MTNREPRRETKGERTHRRIVERAAAVFNTRGVAGTSMADVVDAAGLAKGGIYNHFTSKDELALAAFDYAADVVLARVEAAVAASPTPLGKLLAMLDVYRGVAMKPFPGGCPLLNTAVEADDTHPALRERARQAFSRWRALIANAVADAVAAGELEPVAPEGLASTFVATLEGGIMLAKLYRDPSHLDAVADGLTRYLQLLSPRAARG